MSEKKMVSFEELVKLLQKENPGRVTVVSYADFQFLRDCGVEIDFDLYAGSMMFQQFIHEQGTAEEQQRLRDRKVGYPW